MWTLIKGIQRYKHRLATIALIVGFLVDLVVFRTINLSLAQTVLSVHLVIVASSILVLNIPTHEDAKGFFMTVRSWIPVLQQYSIGNLLSAFLILYSASGSIVTSWPFYLLIIAAVVGNETLKLEKYRLPFQTTLFFLNLLLFTTLAVPVTLNDIGLVAFLLAVSSAIIIFALFVNIGRLVARSAFKTNWLLIRIGWVSVALIITLGYFSNTIPPIPLSVKVASPYYLVERTGESYTAEREVRNFFERFLDLNGESLKLMVGDSAYVFTAIFAPARFSENVVHHWQFYDPERGIWQTSHTVRFPIVGGRDGGYRGFSRVDNPAPGRWRVSVETVRGQVIGRIHFTVLRVSEPPKTEFHTL